MIRDRVAKYCGVGPNDINPSALSPDVRASLAFCLKRGSGRHATRFDFTPKTIAAVLQATLLGIPVPEMVQRNDADGTVVAAYLIAVRSGTPTTVGACQRTSSAIQDASAAIRQLATPAVGATALPPRPIPQAFCTATPPPPPPLAAALQNARVPPPPPRPTLAPGQRLTVTPPLRTVVLPPVRAHQLYFLETSSTFMGAACLGDAVLRALIRRYPPPYPVPGIHPGAAQGLLLDSAIGAAPANAGTIAPQWSTADPEPYAHLMRNIATLLPEGLEIRDTWRGLHCGDAALQHLVGDETICLPHLTARPADLVLLADAFGGSPTDLVLIKQRPSIPDVPPQYNVALRARPDFQSREKRFLIVVENNNDDVHVCCAVPVQARVLPKKSIFLPTSYRDARDTIQSSLKAAWHAFRAGPFSFVHAFFPRRAHRCTRLLCSAKLYHPTGTVRLAPQKEVVKGLAYLALLGRPFILGQLPTPTMIAKALYSYLTAGFGVGIVVDSRPVQTQVHLAACTNGDPCASVEHLACVCGLRTRPEVALEPMVEGFRPGGQLDVEVRRALDSANPSPYGGESGIRAALSVAKSQLSSKGKTVTHDCYLMMQELYRKRIHHEVTTTAFAAGLGPRGMDPVVVYNEVEKAFNTETVMLNCLRPFAELPIAKLPNFFCDVLLAYTVEFLTPPPGEHNGHPFAVGLSNVVETTLGRPLQPLMGGRPLPDGVQVCAVRGFLPRDHASAQVAEYAAAHSNLNVQPAETEDTLVAVEAPAYADGEGDPEEVYLNNRHSRDTRQRRARQALKEAQQRCPKCHHVVPDGATHAASCDMQALCGNRDPHSGLRCGYPLAYGHCGRCEAPAVVAAMEGGAPTLPVNSQPVAMPLTRVRPVSLLKDAGARTVLDAPAAEGVRVTDRQVRPKTKPYTGKNGPVMVVAGPCPPMFCARDRASRKATVRGRILVRMPPGYEVDQQAPWDEFEKFVLEDNWDYIFTNPDTGASFLCPEPITNLRGKKGRRAMGWWCNRFRGEKADKKWSAYSTWKTRGLRKEDLNLTSMQKAELLQSVTKLLTTGLPPQSTTPIGSDGYKTPYSDLAVARVLRFFTTNVVDVLCGPSCDYAARVLKTKVWTGNHPLRYGAGRTSEQTAAFFQRFSPGCDSFIGRDFTLFDNTHGQRSHRLFFKIMQKAGMFAAPEHRWIFEHLFPAHISFEEFTLIVTGGMASGAVWTTLMNTIMNALVSIYSTYKAATQTLALPQDFGLSDVMEMFQFHGTYAGDDSAVMGYGIRSVEQRALLFCRDLGFVVKSKSENSVFQLAFLGATPCPAAKLVSGAWVECWLMVSLPHRHLTTLGVMQEAQPDPLRHVAGVAFAWSRGQGHVPFYGALYREIMRAGGLETSGPRWVTPRLESNFAAAHERALRMCESWSEYCTTIACVSGVTYRSVEETLVALALAWETTPDTILYAEEQMRNLPVPGSICTPEVVALCAGSARR